jgi:hypothetical protein
MATLDQQIATACSSIPECLAAGYIDISSGMILSIKTVDSHPAEVIGMLAAATSDLFAGPNVVAIENLFKKERGLPKDNHHYFQEMIINSDNLIHVFIRGKQHTDYIACFVCRKTANLGMALTKARAAMPEIEASV